MVIYNWAKKAPWLATMSHDDQYCHDLEVICAVIINMATILKFKCAMMIKMLLILKFMGAVMIKMVTTLKVMCAVMK